MTDISMTSASIPARGAAKAKRKQSSVAHDRALTLLVFLPPALLLFTLFVILPMGEAAWYSLYRWNGYGTPTDFVGLKNFQVLFGNAAFSQALINNGLIILISILIQIPLAIWLAMMLAHRIPGVVAFRLVFFLPYVLADVAAGLIWRFVYDGDYGLFAAISNFFGFANPYVLSD
jgi:raffinose/stachyose/melibiose transport system permease protein